MCKITQPGMLVLPPPSDFTQHLVGPVGRTQNGTLSSVGKILRVL